MPRLDNAKHELFAKNYVKDKANATQAYIETYPNVQYDSARALSSGLLANINVKSRCIELLEKQAGSRLDTLLNDLINKKDAERIIIIKDTLHKVADNPVQLEAIKTLLKLHGVLQNNANELATVDNRSITFNINIDDISKISGLLANMKALANSVGQLDGRINDGDAIDVVG